MGAGREEYKVETNTFLEKKEKCIGKKTLLASMEPQDRFNIVYIIILIQGVGTLLPWNMFITAHAYFKEKLQSNESLTHTFENYFSVAAFIPNILVFLLNTLFKHKVSLQARMLTSVCIMTLCFVLTTVLVIVDTSEWTNEFFTITIGTIVVINMSSAVYQGGLFGLSGMLPERYTGAVMTGQGIGGTFAALASIASLLGSKTTVASGFGYFMSAAVVLFLCLILYILLHKMKFVRHYLSPDEGARQCIHTVNANQIGRLANWQIPPSKRSGGLKHSILSLDHDALLAGDVYNSGVEFPYRKERPPFLLIFRQISKPGLSVAFVFFVTLSVFPSLTAKIVSVNKDDKSEWTNTYFVPVTCFLLFNLGDFGGRLMASLVQWPRRESILLPVLCFLRVIFIMLFAFCNAHPRTWVPVYFNKDYFPIIFMALFSLSNGYLGSLCMMYGPSMVESKHAETAGTMMAFLLILGLGLGAAFSFVITMNL